MSELTEMGEDALIERLVDLVPLAADLRARPGDDCAVIDLGKGELTLFKTDAVVSGVHFLPKSPAEAVGWKAVARVISDIAAMGGRPGHFLVTLAVPADTQISWLEDLYRGMGRCLREHGAVLAGGETSRVPEGSSTVISVTALGRVEPEHLVLRSTGRPGDLLLVTGRLGGSLISGRHLSFAPRLAEARWLVQKHRPSAMMDLSDGLAVDLPRLAAASGCGYAIDESALPLAAGCSVDQALRDGEDFELLIALKPCDLSGLMQDWEHEFPQTPLSVIGELLPPGAGQDLSGGWDHFASGLAGMPT
ncbi:MAG: thiamine-phosphate kinase [Luteolibacter sp.]